MNVISLLVPEENSFRIHYSNFPQMARVAAGYRTILRKIFAENLQNELDRSPMNISLFSSLLFSLRSPHYRDKNFYSLASRKLQPERNTTKASDFYFTLLVLRLFIATWPTAIQIEWILCDSPLEYFSRERTTFYILPLRAFLFDEMPWKYIAFKSEFNFCEENEFIKRLICLSQDLWLPNKFINLFSINLTKKRIYGVDLP